ncbi:MAG: polysaccharide deacetylase family protein [Candidatus Zixiibacteriota bacterium]
MKRLIINIILILADWIGINRLFRSLNSNKIRVLMYHGVSDIKMPSFYWTLLDKNEFLSQIAYIRKKYNVVGPENIYAGGNQVGNSVVITFDDGLLNNFTTVLPVLRDNDLQAVCFVLPSLSEKNEMMWTDKLYVALIGLEQSVLDLSKFDLGVWELATDTDKRADSIKKLLFKLKATPHSKRSEILNHVFNNIASGDIKDYDVFGLMSPAQIKELSETGQFSVGAHTNSHPILSTMTASEQEKEIKGGMDKLVEWGISTIPVFAYPNGRAEDFNEETINILKKYGFKAALTTIDGLHDPADDNYRIKRINIGADTGKWEFRARLSGFYYFLQGR